jgi:hypothetical protein
MNDDQYEVEELPVSGGSASEPLMLQAGVTTSIVLEPRDEEQQKLLFGTYRLIVSPRDLQGRVTAAKRQPGVQASRPDSVDLNHPKTLELQITPPQGFDANKHRTMTIRLEPTDNGPAFNVELPIRGPAAATHTRAASFDSDEPRSVISRKESVPSEFTPNVVLQQLIKASCDERMRFSQYQKYMNFLLCGESSADLNLSDADERFANKLCLSIAQGRH